MFSNSDPRAQGPEMDKCFKNSQGLRVGACLAALMLTTHVAVGVPHSSSSFLLTQTKGGNAGHSSHWVPATQVGALVCIPGFSQARLDPVPAIAGIFNG